MDDAAGEAASAPERYIAPPAFAPPQQRVAPLNEVQMLGRTSYPQASPPTGYASPAAPPAPWGYAPPPYQPSPYQPVPWHPALGGRSARSHRSRRLSILAVLSLVAVLSTVVALLLDSGSGSSGRSLSVPEVAGQYTRFETITGSRLSSLGVNVGSFSSSDLAGARAGLYSRSASRQPTLLFIGFDRQHSPGIGAQLQSSSADTVVDEAFAGAGSSRIAPLAVDAGPLGGSIKCATISVTGQQATVGIWADGDTLGVVLEYSPTDRPTPTQMGVITRDLRTAAEH